MASASTKVGHGLAKVLGIKLDQTRPPVDPVTRGESTYSIDTADTYVEEEPTAADWIREITPSPRDVGNYFINLFPFVHWIGRYNVQWLIGDLVAGITIGAVVVPQGMAYATLAQLPVEYGLYTSFMGVLIYWFFATSKDITIGPVAVMSTLVGNIIIKAKAKDKNANGPEIAQALAIVAGGTICGIGLLRIGRIVDFIPLTAISAFMTGSALNICMGQIPTMFGIKDKNYNTRASTYKVFINFWKYIHLTKLDVAPGLTALAMLYLIRWVCTRLAKRYPNRAKLYFFISTLRTAFVILLYTLISWLVNRHHRTNPKFAILKTVPRGFKHAGVPVVNKRVIDSFAGELPAAIIVLLIEHIAIAKSFGRVNNYTINPSQELVAIGITNLLGPFLGAYPATGSFSRTAIKSKAGVRTPFAGVITAVVVLLAIYALTAVFYYIPNAPLAAVIIHAVGDLITPPNVVYQFWAVSPLEVFIFFGGVFATVFDTIEVGVYTTVIASFVLLAFRLLFAKGQMVGKVQVHSVIGDHVVDDKVKDRAAATTIPTNEETSVRNVFLPFKHRDGTNPSVKVEDVYPGVFIYRFSEGFNYPNANNYLDDLTDYVFAHTRRTNPDTYPRLGDRPWNDPGPRRGKTEPDRSHLPTLKAIILDLSSVNNVDVTSVQNLIDVRNQLDKYASPDRVQWHFSGIKNRWAKRALVAGGFGYPPSDGETFTRMKPIFSVAEIGGKDSAAAAADARDAKARASIADAETGNAREITRADSSSDDLDYQKQIASGKAYVQASSRAVAAVEGLNRPFFHLDLTNAVQSAISNIESVHQKRGVGTDDKLA